MDTSINGIAQPKNGPVDVRPNNVGNVPTIAANPVLVGETNPLLNKITGLGNVERTELLKKFAVACPSKSFPIWKRLIMRRAKPLLQY
jgi:hypothetical protein